MSGPVLGTGEAVVNKSVPAVIELPLQEQSTDNSEVHRYSIPRIFQAFNSVLQ